MGWGRIVGGGGWGELVDIKFIYIYIYIFFFFFFFFF